MTARSDTKATTGARLVRVLGLHECAITIGDRTIGPESERQFGLLLYLAIRHPHYVRRDELIELLWDGGLKLKRPSQSLRQLLYRVKQLGAPIETAGSRLRFSEGTVQSDLPRPTLTLTGLRDPRVSVLTSGWMNGYDPSWSVPFSLWLETIRASATNEVARSLKAMLTENRKQRRLSAVKDIAGCLLSAFPEDADCRIALAEALAREGRISDAERELALASEASQSDISEAVSVIRRRLVKPLATDLAIPSQLDEPAFVGSSASLDAFSRLLAGAKSGAGGLTVVIGEEGAGKTRTLREFARVSEVERVPSCTLRCDLAMGASAESAYLSLGRLLCQMRGAGGSNERSIEVFSGSEGKESSEHRQDLIREALLDVLSAVCDEGPVAILLDDAHLLTRAAMALLHDLSRQTESSPIALAVCGRPSTLLPMVAPSSSVQEIAPLRREEVVAIAREAGLRLGLSPSESDLATIASYSLGSPRTAVAAALTWKRSSSHESLVAELSQVASTHLATFHPNEISTLQILGILDKHVTIERLARISRLDSMELARVVSRLSWRGLLDERSEGPRLLYPEIAKVALGGLSTSGKQVLSLACATELFGQQSEPPSAKCILHAASLFIDAGADEKAIDALHLVASRDDLPLDDEATKRLSELALRVQVMSPKSETAIPVILKRVADSWDCRSTAPLLESQYIRDLAAKVPSALPAFVLAKSHVQRRDRTSRPNVMTRISDLTAITKNPLYSLERRIESALQLLIVADLAADHSEFDTTYLFLNDLAGGNGPSFADFHFAQTIRCLRRGNPKKGLASAKAALKLACDSGHVTNEVRARRYVARSLFYGGSSFDTVRKAFLQALEATDFAGLSVQKLNVLNELSAHALHRGQIDDAQAWMTKAHACSLSNDDSGGRGMLSEIWRVAHACSRDASPPPDDLRPEDWTSALANGWIRNRAHTLACHAIVRSSRQEPIPRRLRLQIESDFAKLAPHGDSDVVAAGLALSLASNDGAGVAREFLAGYLGRRRDRMPLHFVFESFGLNAKMSRRSSKNSLPSS